jgi:hypothetical protein
MMESTSTATSKVNVSVKVKVKVKVKPWTIANGVRLRMISPGAGDHPRVEQSPMPISIVQSVDNLTQYHSM